MLFKKTEKKRQGAKVQNKTKIPKQLNFILIPHFSSNFR
jgi:hypothetical protein